MRKVGKNRKRILAGVLAAAMAIPSAALFGSGQEAQAQCRAGTAPYINTWLVAGPSETSVIDAIYAAGSSVELPSEETKLTVASAEASTILNDEAANYGADKAVDGDAETYWSSYTVQGKKWDKNMALTVTLEDISTVTKLKVIPHERDGKKIDVFYQILHETGAVLGSGSLENLTPGETYEIVLDKPLVNAAKVVFTPAERKDTGNTAPNHLGFDEVEVYGAAGITDDGGIPALGDISPVLGEDFGDTKWQYFDDRIFNRNLDDWQDLYGYFKVKQGLETEGKYVYAHTYVYSETEQEAQLRFVTSGLHKVYLNDVLVDANAVAVESTNKDNYIQNVMLKQGWNKLMLEIQHTRVSYLGFYARITTPANGTGSDSAGDLLEGITCSVTGPHTAENALTVVTQGLDIDKEAFKQRNAEAGIESNMYPDNEMPNGYVEYPYVWNEAIWRVGESYAAQASKFQFEAAGGTPGYTWAIIDGQLPDGLTMDASGQIDGYCTTIGEYTFTVQVTDTEGNTASKELTINVKERPSKWFEVGKMSALSHDTGAYTQFFDPNFSFDLWAERAKEAGMTMLSTEAVQGVYYWPAPGTFPGDPTGAAEKQHPYTTEIVDGVRQVKDMVGLAKEAAERHGLRFGVYYASEGSNRISDSRVDCSSGFFMNVEDLMKRYDPSYLFFDGHPQKRGNADAMWSAVRAYNDYALIQANDTNEVSDNDLTTYETEYYGKEPYTEGQIENKDKWVMNMHNQNKYTVMEAWCHPCIQEVQGWRLRDDWRLWAEFIIDQIGHGYVVNYDQMIVSNRGVNWNGYSYNANTADVYYYYPLNAQKFIDIRENVNAWLENAGGPNLMESLYGTMPYIVDTYEKPAVSYENTEKEPFLSAKYGEGPDWGYVVGRDQYVYMHMIENTIGNLSGTDISKKKTGFTGQDSIYIGPFDYDVTKVEWLNEGKTLKFTQTEENGKKYITIDTTSVEADPVDTIIKITTADPNREFKLTSVKLYSSQENGNALQLRAEAYMNDYTSVFAPAALTYTSDNPGVATVDASGLVKPVAAGTTTIRVTASYEGETATDTYQVQVKSDGTIAAAEELIGVVLRTEGRETYGEFSTDRSLSLTFEGRTDKGGGTNILAYDDIVWHYGICSGITSGEPEEEDGYWHAREVEDNDVLEVVGDKVIFKGTVTEEQNLAIWADITVNGQTFTTNMNYLRIYPNALLSEGIAVEASSGTGASQVVDGVLNSADGGNTSKWTAGAEDENPNLTLTLDDVSDVSNVVIYYNNKDRYYMNTPANISIEVSEDGEEWTMAVASGSVPSSGTGYAYEEDKYSYPINAKAKYVRVTFPGGAREETLDVLEIQVMGYDNANTLTELALAAQTDSEQNTIRVDITGLAADGSEVDLSGAEITMTSDAPEVAYVDDNHVIHAGKQAGVAKITVAVEKQGAAIAEMYVTVDENGIISVSEYAASIEVSLTKDILKYGETIAANVTAKTADGKSIDLSEAEVEYQISDSRIAPVEGTDNIFRLTEEVNSGFEATIKAVVTVNEITTKSDPVTVSVVGMNLAYNKDVVVSTTIGKESENEEKLVDGSTGTKWCSEDGAKGDIQWAVIDLGELSDLTGYRMYHAQAGGEGSKFNTRAFKLQYAVTENPNGANDEDWADIVSVEDNTAAISEGTFEETINTRYVRLYITAPIQDTNASRQTARIYELELYGTTASQSVGTIETITAPTELAVDSGTTFADLELPAGVEVVLDNGQTFTIPVTWSDNGYLENVDGTYLLQGTFAVSLEELGIVNTQNLVPGITVKVGEDQTDTVDKSLLQATYDYALTLSTEGVTDSAVKFFENAKAAAKAVLENEEATQEDVAAAWDDLLTGIWGLGIVQGDKTNLELLIAKADSMLPNADKYVATCWPQLTEALAAAKEVYADGDALDEDIEPAADALLNAILAQRYKANKANLQALINKVSGTNLSQYTVESAAVFTKALQAANSVMANEALSVDDQAVVDQAEKELNEAYNNLVKQSADDGNGSGTDGSGSTDGRGTNGSGSTDGTGTNGSGSTDGKDDGTTTAKTGDQAPIALWIGLAILMLAAMGAAVLVRTKLDRMDGRSAE